MMHLDDIGIRHLAAAVVLRAVKDYKDPKRQPEVTAFFTSRWGRCILDALDIGERELRGVLHSKRKTEET